MSKDLDRLNPVELLILASLIRGGEQYGLKLVDTAKEISSGRQRLSLGGIYTMLHRLERKGLVESRWGDEALEERKGARRRYYQVTGHGAKTLAAKRQSLLETLELIPA
jgi:PadR family transcriptional regulator, regulatory protein PadR